MITDLAQSWNQAGIAGVYEVCIVLINMVYWKSRKVIHRNSSRGTFWTKKADKAMRLPTLSVHWLPSTVTSKKFDP